MTISTRKYAEGTSVTVAMPWGNYVKARVLCSDGVVRATSRISMTADTFYSVPAAVKVSGKTVSGYVTFIEREDGNSVAAFERYSYGKNANMLPENHQWPPTDIPTK